MTKKDVATQQADPGMTLVEKAIEKGMDPDALGKLMDLAERQSKEVARQAWHKAMAEFQSKCPVIRKDGIIQGGKSGEKKWTKAKFASYPQIMAQIGPILRECDLSLTFRDTVNEDGSVTTACLVHHIGGHVDDSGSFTGPPRAKLWEMSDYQESGAAQAYRKRYATISALNLVTDDDDESQLRTPVKTITENEANALHKSMAPLSAKWKQVFLDYFDIEVELDLPAIKLEEAQKRIASALAKKAKADAKKAEGGE